MGYDAACTIHIDGEEARGTALLEQHELRFRGPFRLAIPLKEITSATATGGTLAIRFGKRTARLDLGPAAPKWADKITNPPSRLDKLGVKEGMTVLVISLTERPFLDEIEARGATVVKKAPDGGADLVFYGAERRDALDRLDSLRGSIVPHGAIWVIRPKGQPAITESDVMAAGKRAGLVDVKVVSFSETHTAEKFVIPVAKRAAPARSSRAPRRRGSSASPGRS